MHKPSLLIGLLLLVISSMIVPSASVAGSFATSTFEFGDDGWLLAGDSTTGVPAFVPAGGNPGGFIRGVDSVVGGVWFFSAPSKFLGDDSATYGQNLSFDLRMRGSGPLFDDSDVILSGAGLNLVYDTTAVPQDPIWTSYSIPLVDTAGWKVGSLVGPAPTQAQFLAVLSALTSLWIRGEFITGSDSGDLDNVTLGAVPEPNTLVLAGVVLSAFGAGALRKASIRPFRIGRWTSLPMPSAPLITRRGG
jgi:hypothetical protein